MNRTLLPFQPKRSWSSRATFSFLLLPALFLSLAVAPSNAGATGSTTTPGIARSIQSGSHSHSKKVAADLPVADNARFSPPRRGCNFSPASATYGATSSNTTTLHVHAPLALGHCRVLEVGDSLGDDLGFGLSQELGKTSGLNLIVKDQSSTGLAATWFYNWPQHFASYLSEYHPNLVIAVFGANDEQALAVHGVSQPFGSLGWRTAYVARVRRIDQMATKAGSYLLWVGLPIVQPTIYRQGLYALNAIDQKVATSIPGVTFQPSWSLFATKSGDYRSGAMVNHQSDGLRLSDGIHFNSTGELVWGTFVARQLATIYNVKIGPRTPMTIDG